MKHDHPNQTLWLEGPPPANNPGARILDMPPAPKKARALKRCDLPGQELFWRDADTVRSGIKCVALAAHWTLTEAAFVETLTRAARDAAKHFRHCKPRSMDLDDFASEIMVKSYKEALRWRETGKKSFRVYIRSIAMNRARDILRTDEAHNAVKITDDELQHEADRRGYDLTTMTVKQLKKFKASMRRNHVEFIPVFHREPQYEIENDVDDSDENG